MTKKGAVAAKTAVLKRRTFTREFKLQFFGDRPVTVRAHLQSDTLNLPAQLDLVG